jgi:hypothetical protein
VESPPPDLLTSARRFTIAFAAVALFGLVVSVVIPFVLPGPKWLTISLGSCCFILILVVGGRLLRRGLLRLQTQGEP